MWVLTVRSAAGEPRQYVLKPGRTSLGRQTDNTIVIPDESASRHHAEVLYTLNNKTATLIDLGSTNGTFLNRERVTQQRQLKPNDEIRIGQHLISVEFRDTYAKPPATPKGTSALTRDVLIESVDRHAVLMYEVSERLATVLDLDTALREVANLLRRSMGADKSEVILSERFDRLSELGFPTSIAQQAIEQRAAVIIPDMSALEDGSVGQSAFLLRLRSALCVPVLTGDTVEALIYAYKTGPLAKPFDHRDLQLAIAISHQAALTIQRARLLRRVRREQRIRELLQRFLSPAQAEMLLQDYMKAGRLPEMAEQMLTIMFADLRDSTGLAERVGPRRFSEILGLYYQLMTQLVFENGGLLHQYSGDGIMAVFGMFDKTDPAGSAISVAQAFLNNLDPLRKLAGETIQIGIGINTGPAMAGYLELKERIEFSVLGDTVNVTQRLQTLARTSKIIIGPLTQQAVQGRFAMQSVGHIEVRGRAQALDVYELVPEAPP